MVGVGTGGCSSVKVGEADPETTVDGGTALGTTIAALAVGVRADSTAMGLVVGGDQSTIDSDLGVVARAGATPIPPAPPGALTAGNVGAGVPSVQPTVTANGRPRVTRPKKMDLGENRTS
ncbi:hypothetical protein [Actinoplanes sp. NPDC049118]|uniref:hypothetical protein n=1 Tax=Actinoplanes sp. NPDC049118 TaxID=3155769 RepID=UPI0033F4B64C